MHKLRTYNTSAKPQLSISFVHLLMGSQFNKFHSFLSYIWISRRQWRHAFVTWATSSSSCTSLPANLCFLFYAIFKGCNGPILNIFFLRRFVFSQAFQCHIQNFATAKTKGVAAKIVWELENVGEGGGKGGDDCFSKDDIQKRICIKFNIYIFFIFFSFFGFEP